MQFNMYAEHLTHPVGRDHRPERATEATAGGAACGDLITVFVQVTDGTVSDVGFTASGCGAVTASGSAVVELARGASVLEAAKINTTTVSEELEVLSPERLHAAELAADAFARALGQAVYAHGAAQIDDCRTLVAMSGGVDSSAVALLVADGGREVVGVTLQLWADPENDAESSCCSITAVRQARMQAHKLGFPHFTLDLRDEFRAGVVDPYLDAHRDGLTPNPCVRCNGDVRIDAMLDFASRAGCADLATGHYARVAQTEDGPLLALARDIKKDQTYMLTGLSPASLARLRFPLGDMTKPEVRQFAEERELFSAKKPDSQDLCFLAGTDRARFLRRHGDIADRPGDIVTTDGEVIGRHDGTHHFTVGQRKGLGIGGTSEPLFVVRVEPREQRVIVGTRDELGGRTVAVAGVRLHRPGACVNAVKLRYKQTPVACRIAGDVPAGRSRMVHIELDDPTLVAAPGQTACLMDGDRVVGFGTIAPQVS